MVEKENLKLAEVAPDKYVGAKIWKIFGKIILIRKKKGQKGGEKTDAEKAARRRREERKYLEVRYERYGSCPIRFWERIGHALPSMNVRLHEAVESCLNRQLKLLNLRATAVQACVDIEKENVEVSMQM